MTGAGHGELPLDTEFRAANEFFANARSEFRAHGGQAAGHCGESRCNMRTPVLVLDNPECHLSKQAVVVILRPEMRSTDIRGKLLPFIFRKTARARPIR